MDIYQKIRYYHEQENRSQRWVAKALGISRNTVSKYWDGETVPWKRKSGSGRKNDVITEEVKAFIISCFEEDKNAPRKQHHTAHRIYERLVDECGFTGCESSVRNAVAQLRCNYHKTFVPLAYEPAEAVQIDWGEATVEISGKRQKIQIWCMRECFSEAIFVTAFYRQNQESFLEGIVKGLEFFGGSPKKMIFDNARVAVKEGFGHYAKATDKYKDLSAHYAFNPVFCNPASGHEKGLVEGLVGLVRRNCLSPVPKVRSLSELNDLLLDYCKKYKKHKVPSKNNTVGERLEMCRCKWIPLPPYRFDTSNTLQLKVDEFSLVKFDHNKYSVPCRYSSQTVTVKGTGNKVRVIFNNKTIAEYDRDYHRNNTHYKLEHYIELIERKPGSVYNAAPIKETVPAKLYDFLMKSDSPQEIVKVLRLYLEKGDEVLKALPYSDSFETLFANVNKYEGNEENAEINFLHIKIPVTDLKQYNVLMEGGESL